MKTKRSSGQSPEHIVNTPDVLLGEPRLEGTRIKVSLILGYLAAGRTFTKIIGQFPDLTEEQIAACLAFRGLCCTLGRL